MCQTKHHYTLYRKHNNKTRYYKLFLYPTLFNEYLLIKEYGALKNKKPTRVIQKYFPKYTEALQTLNSILYIKRNKGYKDSKYLI